MPIEPSVVHKILVKHCYGAPQENREACEKALNEVFEAYRAKTSNRIADLEMQVDEYEETLVAAREAKEEAEEELEGLELDREWEDAIKQFWKLCERTKA